MPTYLDIKLESAADRIRACIDALERARRDLDSCNAEIGALDALGEAPAASIARRIRHATAAARIADDALDIALEHLTEKED